MAPTTTHSDVITYGLELGVDTPDRGRICALDHAPFPTEAAALAAAQALRGTPASTVKANAPTGLEACEMDATAEEMHAPIVGATVYSYSDAEGTLNSRDLADAAPDWRVA